MSLIDRLIEPTKKYISFRDLLFHLSSSNNEPLYEVVTYLLHHDLNSIGFYNIDTDYKIIKFEPFEFNSVTEFLEEVQKALEISACEWVFSSSESLDELIESDRKLLTDAVFKAMHSFFKKSELLSFKPLDGLLHFDPENITDANRSSDSVEQKLANALAKIDRLEQSKADGSFSMGAPTVAHGEDKTYKQLNNELAAANAKIKQQEQDIDRLSDQLKKQTDKHLYDWQAMNKNQYPPELHLAMEIWGKYYQAGEIEYITQFNTGKFNRIANELNLKEGNLKDRIRTLLTPLVRKLKAPSLIESFDIIDIIHTEKLEQD